MSLMNTLILAGLLIVLACLSASAAAKRPAPTYNYYHFDGNAFIAGSPAGDEAYLAIGDGMTPLVLKGRAKVAPAALPAGKGAIAGICYIQSSGGKLSSGKAFIPCNRQPITISTAKTVVKTVQSDQDGYFTAILDPGVYIVGSPPLAVEVVVDKGTSRLVPLRAGKRMVD